MSDFLELLSSTPNVEHINLTYSNIFQQKTQTQSHAMDQTNNECLKLYQLKTLELIECGKEFLVVFHRLPADVLKEFTIGYWNIDLDLLADFFTQQSNIKKLILSDENEDTNIGLPDHIFDHLKLESLECYQCEYDSSHAKILFKQTQLTSLSLLNGESDAKINEDVLNVITKQLGELETLEITVSEALIVPFKMIVNLKKLRELTLLTCSLKFIDALSRLDNSRITTLNLKYVVAFDEEDDFDDGIPPMPINIIAALANSVPNLKVLQFDHRCDAPSIIAVMQHFNFVEVLYMKFVEHIDANRLSKKIEVECFNPKLTELTIDEYFLCDESILTKFIAMYPNLKRLDVSASKPVTTSQFKLILNGFKKMNLLELRFRDFGWKCNLTAEYLDCIKNHTNNLKSLTLVPLNEITAEYKKELGTVFDVIRHNNGGLYMVNERDCKYLKKN